MKSPRQLKIVSFVFSGMNLPAMIPIELPKITASELNTVPPAGIDLKISSMTKIFAPYVFCLLYARLMTRDRIDAEKIPTIKENYQ